MPLKLSRLSWSLALFALFQLVVLAPTLSVIAPRCIGLLLPLVALFGLPWFVAQKPSLTFLKSPWAILTLALLTFGFIETTQTNRIDNVLLVMAGSALGLWVLRSILCALPPAFAPRVFMSLGISILTAGLLLLIEWQTNMGINRWIKDLPESPVFQLYELDRAIIVATLLLWPVFAFWRQRGGAWWPLLLVAYGLAYPLWQTSSQASAVALPLGMTVALITSIGGRRFIQVYGAAIMLGLLLAPFIIVALVHVLGDDPMLLYRASAGERLRIWSKTVQEIVQHPLLGQGIEAVRGFGSWGKVRGHPHNGFLQIWAEFGAIGVAFALLVLRQFFKALAALPHSLAPMVLGSFTAWLFVFVVGYGMWQPWWLATALTLFGLHAYVLALAAPSSSSANHSQESQ